MMPIGSTFAQVRFIEFLPSCRVCEWQEGGGVGC